MEQIVKQVTDRAESAVVSLITEKITGFIVQRLTWFAFPPLSWGLSFVLGRIIPDLYKEGSLNLTYWGIDYDEHKEGLEAKKARDGLASAIAGGNQDDIAKAEKDFDDRYAKLIGLNSD